MAKMTGGQALARSLHREGVRVIFGLPGFSSTTCSTRFTTSPTFASSRPAMSRRQPTWQTGTREQVATSAPPWWFPVRDCRTPRRELARPTPPPLLSWWSRGRSSAISSESTEARFTK